jgi:hypothetical protein
LLLHLNVLTELSLFRVRGTHPGFRIPPHSRPFGATFAGFLRALDYTHQEGIDDVLHVVGRHLPYIARPDPDQLANCS